MYYGKLCCDGCFLIGAFHSELLHNMHKIKMHFYYYQRFLLPGLQKMFYLAAFIFIRIFLAPLVAVTKKQKQK